MMKIPMDICMKTLDGYINDEDQLVTYKWLSNEMEIHVNVAKQILEEYWNRHKNDGIIATIMLIGFLKGGEMRVELVKECNLDIAMEKYSKIISQHIYSLQKTLSDIELLAGVGPGNTKYGAIHCEKSVVLSDEELFARRWGAATTFLAPPEERKPPVDRAADAKKSNGIGKFLKESAENKKPAEETVKDKQEEKSEEKKISPPRSKVSPKKGPNPKKNVQSTKTGFSNLFGKVSAANQKKSPPSTNNTKNVSTEKKSETMKENVVNKNNPVEKSASAKRNASVSNEESLKEETSSKKQKFSNEKVSPKDESEKVVEQSTSEEKKLVTNKMPESKSIKNKKTKRGTKRERSQESKLDAKKRKRIVVASDTSDESAESEEEIVYDSPPREQIVERPKARSPPPVQNINGRRKIRKLVDKTFMDEDGYLVTRKEHVYESCSEEEEEPVKVPEPKIATSEPPARIIKKQTTLTSFFKKP